MTRSASKGDATSVAQQQVDDLRAVLRGVHNETHQAVILFGISLGGSAACEPQNRSRRASSRWSPSPLIETLARGRWAHAFSSSKPLFQKNLLLSAKLKKLGELPCTEVGPFQLRASMSADLGTVEHGKKFSSR